MKKTFLGSLAMTCAFGLLAARVDGQQALPDQPNQNAQGGIQVEEQDFPDQQAIPSQPQRTDEQSQLDEPYRARRVDPSANSQQAGHTVQDCLIQKLTYGNKAEIELSQMAVQKAQHPGLKQFAQTLIQDHQNFNQQLQQLQSGQQGTSRSGQAEQGSQRRPLANRQTPERTGAAQAGEQPTLGATATERGRSSERTGNAAWQEQNQQVPQELVRVMQRASEKHLQMAKQALEQQQGQDFDMGFLTMQIAGHYWMVAELEAMQDVGSKEFQQLVSQASQTTSEHLSKAKQLAADLENDRETANQGGRANTPERQPVGQRLRRSIENNQPERE